MAEDLRSLLASPGIRDAVRRRRYGVVRAAPPGPGPDPVAGRGARPVLVRDGLRLDTGSRRLADIDTLRRLAGARKVSPEVFRLTPETGGFRGSTRAGAVPRERRSSLR